MDFAIYFVAGFVCLLQFNIIIQLANACLLFRYIDLVKQWKCAYAYFRTNLHRDSEDNIYIHETYGVQHTDQCLDDKLNSLSTVFRRSLSPFNGLQFTEIDEEEQKV